MQVIKLIFKDIIGIDEEVVDRVNSSVAKIMNIITDEIDELKKIGSPDNPDILVDRAGNVWLLNLKTRKAINTGRSLDIFKK